MLLQGSVSAPRDEMIAFQQVSRATNPLYLVMHESIYAQPASTGAVRSDTGGTDTGWAAQRVLAGQPFAVDHLGDPVFDAALPARLPVGFASIPSARDHERALADPALRTWSDYAGPMAFEAGDATSGTYREEGGQTTTIALLARGDFNGDGIGDALLQSHEAASGGSWRTSRLFLVTQRTQDGPIELLETFDAWQGSSP